MVIVAGQITVDPERRESYLAGSMSVAEYDIADVRPLFEKGRSRGAPDRRGPNPGGSRA
jgi:hypothetical protein